MDNLTCAACGRALAETSAWKGSGERFYCNDFCAEAEETYINLIRYAVSTKSPNISPTNRCHPERWVLLGVNAARRAGKQASFTLTSIIHFLNVVVSSSTCLAVRRRAVLVVAVGERP